MAIVTVEIPDKKAIKFAPFSVIKIEELFEVFNYHEKESEIEFDFKKENIDQDEFLACLKKKYG